MQIRWVGAKIDFAEPISMIVPMVPRLLAVFLFRLCFRFGLFGSHCMRLRAVVSAMSLLRAVGLVRVCPSIEGDLDLQLGCWYVLVRSKDEKAEVEV